MQLQSRSRDVLGHGTLLAVPFPPRATNGSFIMSAEHFQNLIIGSGVAGKIIGWTLAS
jgi:hypothetical protein